MIAKFDQLVEKISKQSGLTVEDIKRRVEAKRAKLSGLISKEGAAQVVAAELGISFDKSKLKINELMDGMKRVGVTAKIINISPVREFMKKENKSKVVNLSIADDTGSTRAVLWDTNHISLIEEEKIKNGDVIEIKNASVRGGELHLGNFSSIAKSAEVLENIIEKELLEEKSIISLPSNKRAEIRATIVQLFEPKFFPVCPECSRRAIQEADKFICQQHNTVVPKYGAIFTTIIDDGTDSMRGVCFSETIKKLFNISDLDELRNTEFFINKKEELLGKELLFSGMTRQNKMFGNNEFVISDVSEADPDKILEKLQK